MWANEWIDDGPEDDEPDLGAIGAGGHEIAAAAFDGQARGLEAEGCTPTEIVAALLQVAAERQWAIAEDSTGEPGGGR